MLLWMQELQIVFDNTADVTRLMSVQAKDKNVWHGLRQPVAYRPVEHMCVVCSAGGGCQLPDSAEAVTGRELTRAEWRL
jgi:hypothetical protein